MADEPIAILGYEHVGIRVSDRDEAVAFYGQLGFGLESDLPEHSALVMVAPSGTRINLIYNGTRRPGGSNVLMDEARKDPGVTHPAFVVPSLEATQRTLAELGIAVTAGPVQVGNRRICFIRDPDGNVVEFDEYTGASGA